VIGGTGRVLHRGDFKKWIAETIGDKELASQIENCVAKGSLKKLRSTLQLDIRCENRIFKGGVQWA
jgi:hypothetical protein